MQNTSVKSAYIHIPFCKKICSYCDFCKNFYKDELTFKYLDALEKEINNNYNGEILDTLYIGGGTPSALSIKNLKKLFNILKIFKLNNKYEFTFECNYEDINDEMLRFLKKNKVNRLSIGIQTFNNKYKSFLNRNINELEMIKKINLSKKYFDNINVDLIYALKNETIEELNIELDKFIKLDINHISIYALIKEPNTKLYIDNYIETSDEVEADMYQLICTKLKEHGYNHYEISNFSKPGYESLHNTTYWNNNYYYGFGASASGFINNIRYDNTKSVYNYIKGVTKVNSEVMNNDMLINDEIMLNLRKCSGINKTSFKLKYNKDIEDMFNLSEMIYNGYIICDKDNIYIPEKYLFLSNRIIFMFLENKKKGK